MHFTPRHGVYMVLLILTVISLGCMATPAYPPPNGSDQVWVEYLRTGGIAAFNDHLIIYENRTAEVTRRNLTTGPVSARFTLNETAAGDLNDLFAQANFLHLNQFYPAPSPGADYFVYTIAYRGYGIRTEDTGIPPELVPIIEALNRLLEEECSGDVCPIP
jgi:hypothetical protein